MADKKPGYVLRTHWQANWEKDPKRGKYRGNVHRDAAQLKLIAEDVGLDEAQRIINFYFQVEEKPSFIWFVFNYDKLRDELDRRDEDRKHRASIREATRRRMKELEN